MKFEIFKDRKGEFRFRFVARNGKTVCASEGYKRKQSMLNGIECIKKGLKKAKIVMVEE